MRLFQETPCMFDDDRKEGLTNVDSTVDTDSINEMNVHINMEAAMRQDL